MIYSWLLCKLWEYEKWKWEIISSGAASLNILYSAGHAQLTIPINPSPLIISFCNFPLWYVPSILFTFGSFFCFPSILSSCLFLPVVFFSAVIRLWFCYFFLLHLFLSCVRLRARVWYNNVSHVYRFRPQSTHDKKNMFYNIIILQHFSRFFQKNLEKRV